MATIRTVRRVRYAALALTVAGLAACASPAEVTHSAADPGAASETATATVAEPTTASASASASSSVSPSATGVAELRAAERTWRDHAFPAYRFRYTLACFCVDVDAT